jgi:hypothetical protein
MAMALRLMAAIALIVCSSASAQEAGASNQSEWLPLFNGKNLAGWTIKIAGHPLNENFADTFRVEDGIIKVSYDRYGKFEERFGHLYTNQPYSNYILRLDYRITGGAIADAPPWAKLNSGVMIHSQSPLSMELGQAWPASMEMQFLAVGTSAGRQTGNAVTPGTNLVLNGEVVTDHIIDSTAKLYPADDWVTAEIEVHGNEEVVHALDEPGISGRGDNGIDPESVGEWKIEGHAGRSRSRLLGREIPPAHAFDARGVEIGRVRRRQERNDGRVITSVEIRHPVHDVPAARQDDMAPIGK